MPAAVAQKMFLLSPQAVLIEFNSAGVSRVRVTLLLLHLDKTNVIKTCHDGDSGDVTGGLAFADIQDTDGAC